VGEDGKEWEWKESEEKTGGKAIQVDRCVGGEKRVSRKQIKE
jgi:hypothetical protein